MPILGTPDEIRYRLKQRHPDGTLTELGLLTTKRERKLGDYLNLPVSRDAERRLWRIADQPEEGNRRAGYI